MLARKYPIREFSELNDVFNRFFDQSWNNPQQLGVNVPLDLTETEEGFVLKASLPGLNADDLDITFSNDVLTIKGEVKPDLEGDSSRYLLKERWYGAFQRSLMLPSKIMVDKVQAHFEEGVLTLHLPKSEEVRPRRIQIQSNPQSKAIEGKISTRS